MRLWLDPAKLASLSLGVDEVLAAVREQNVQVAAGQIGGQPSLPGVEFQYTVNAQGRLQTEEEFGTSLSRTVPTGETTYLRDIARLELGPETYALRSMLDWRSGSRDSRLPVARGQCAAAFGLSTQDDGPALEDLSEGVTYEIDYDPTVFVRHSIEAVIHTLFEAVGLVVLVVILFLQTWRASVIPLVAVPVAIVGTLAALLAGRFLDQFAYLFGLGARYRHRGRRCDRGGGKYRAQDRGRAGAAAGGSCCYEGGDASDHLHYVGVVRGVRARGVRQWAHRAVLSPVRYHDRGEHAHLDVQLPDPVSALAALLLKPRSAPPDFFQRGINKVLGRFFGLFNRTFERGSVGVRSRGAAYCWGALGSAGDLRDPVVLHLGNFPCRAGWLHSGAG